MGRAPLLLFAALAPWLAACHDWAGLSKNFHPAGAGAAGSGASGTGATGGGGASSGGAAGNGGAGGAPAPYCTSLESSPVLCNDFDGVGPLVGWEKVDDPPGGAIDVDDGAALSPPRALHVEIPAGGDFLPAFLQQPVTLPADGALLGFDLRVDAGSDEPTLVAALQDYGPDCAVGVEIIAGGARVVQWGDAGSSESPFVALAPLQAWSRVELHFDRSSDPATVRIDVDGGTSTVLDADPCADAPYIQIGALYAPPGSGWDLRFDNLLVRVP